MRRKNLECLSLDDEDEKKNENENENESLMFKKVLLLLSWIYDTEIQIQDYKTKLMKISLINVQTVDLTFNLCSQVIKVW